MKKIFNDFKNGVLEVFAGKANDDNLFKLNGKVHLKKAILFGIQHVLAMFIANITPLILVFSSLGILSSPIATNAMLSAMFMAGFGTILQVLIGARLPIVIGTSFTFVGVFTTIGISEGGGINAYYTILGSIFIGGIITTFCCFFIKWWGKLIKSIVPCVVVLGIGLSLMKSGATQFLGGNDAFLQSNTIPYYLYIIVALITLTSTVLWQLFAKNSLKSLNIIFGIFIGYIVCLFIPNMIDFSSLQINSINDVLSFPHFIDFSKLRFKAIPIILTTICFLMAVVEGIGDVNALCIDAINRKPTQREISGVLVCDGFNSFLCSFFGCLPLTTFAQNVGIVTQSKVTNRFTIFIGALFLIITSFCPFIASFLTTIPECVLGGVMIILFGSIIIVGMKMCAKATFSDKNVLILAISFCLGFGITLVSDFYTFLENNNLGYISVLLSNNVLNMFVISFILSWLLPDNMNLSLFKKNKK
ncbi:MAG: purine/pyrimidine permease [Erysipelotrichaceae bacterium]|nr:purine/pyrimidine permease [Erysipelotrichaceae bacterium]